MIKSWDKPIKKKGRKRKPGNILKAKDFSPLST